MNTLDPADPNFMQHVAVMQINFEDLERKHKLLEGRFKKLEQSYFAESGDRLLTVNDFSTAIAQLATGSDIQTALKNLARGIGEAFGEHTRSVKAAPAANDSEAHGRINALEAVVRRLEASNEHLLREVKLLHLVQKTPAGKFDAAVKARSDVLRKSQLDKSGRTNGKAKALPVVRLTDAAIVKASRTSKTNRTVRHA